MTMIGNGSSRWMWLVLAACSEFGCAGSGHAPESQSVAGMAATAAGGVGVTPSGGSAGSDSMPPMAGTVAGAGGRAPTAGGAGSTAGAASMAIAGSPATAGALANAGAGAGGMAGAGSVDQGDLGMGDGSDVITLGDSWMAGIAPPFREVSGQPYPNYSVGGAPLLEETTQGGFIPGRSTIVEQYAEAIMDNAQIKTVVLTAGGIDVLEGPGGGADGNMAIATALQGLFATMAADGVRDIVYFSYSRSQGQSIETLYQTQMAACRAVPAPTRCHVIDADTIIMGVLGDGIHPSAQGSRDLAAAAFRLMMEKGMRR